MPSRHVAEYLLRQSIRQRRTADRSAVDRREMPERMCVYVVSQSVIPFALMNEPPSECLDPNEFHFMLHVRCLNVGGHCSPYGGIMAMRFQGGDLVLVLGWKPPSLGTAQGRLIAALRRSPAHRQTCHSFERSLVSGSKSAWLTGNRLPLRMVALNYARGVA
jgi:hypothetical protein